MKDNLRLVSVKRYAYLVLAAALLETRVLSVEVGGMQLSLYRFLLLLFPLFMAGIGVGQRQALRRNYNYNYLFVLFLWLVYSVLSLLWVKDYHTWLRAFFFLACGTFGTSVIALSFKARQDFIVAFKVVEMMLVMHAVLALYNIFTGDYSWSPEDYSDSNQVNGLGLYYPSGLLGNLNTVCFYMFWGFLNSLLLLREKQSKAGKAVSLLAMCVFGFVLIVGESRGALAGLAVGLMVVCYCALCKTRPLRPVWKRNIKLCLIAGLLVGLWFMLEKILHLFLTGSDGDTARIALIKNGVYFLKQSWGGGVGLGNIEYYMANGNPPYHTYGIVNIHNWWMEILVSSGIGIFLLYVWVYLWSLWLTYRHIHSQRHFAQVCVLGSMCGFIIASFSGSSMMGMEGVWLIMGLAFFFVGNSTFYNESDVDIDDSAVKRQ
ncbi:MAG: O-antigen ligase family protein [Bacteroidales bacterium]|nr:O-antigen ligase family protein [Bacteroidales bacterium]